ncbi:hypothetical protein Tco_0241011 [Tanacetum coccineum]
MTLSKKVRPPIMRLYDLGFKGGVEKVKSCWNGVIDDKEIVMSKEGWLWSESGCEGLVGFDSNEKEVVPKLDDVSSVDGVFDGAFGGEGEEDVVIGEGVVVTENQTLVINRSLDPLNEDYIELNDLNKPFELRRNQGDDLMPTIKEDEVIEEFRTRDDELDDGINDYPSYCNYDKKIHIDYKMVYKGNNVIGALMNVPIFVGTFSVVIDFAVLENMDDYRDEGMGDQQNLIWGVTYGDHNHNHRKLENDSKKTFSSWSMPLSVRNLLIDKIDMLKSSTQWLSEISHRSDSELRPGYNGKFLEYGDHGMSDDQRMMNGIGSLGPVFLLGLSAFAMAAACASRAVVKSAISCRRASKVMAGVSDVDVLLGGILFNIDKTRSKIVISQVLKALRSCGMIHGAGCNDQNVEMMMERANDSSGTKKYQGPNSSDGGNTGDGVKIAGGVIGSDDEIEFSEELKELLSDEAGKESDETEV